MIGFCGNCGQRTKLFHIIKLTERGSFKKFVCRICLKRIMEHNERFEAEKELKLNELQKKETQTVK